MAFGGLRTTFKNSATSISTSLAATGSQAVRLGDLIFVVGGEQTTLTITGVTDNLGNSYTSCNNTVNDAGTSTGRAFWARVKDDGTLTTVTMAANGGTSNGVIVVAIIEGPITNAIDADPANAANADLSSPFVCPTTGTLSQANEIVIGFLVGTGSTANTATSPNLLADQQATASILHATIGYQAVTVTTAVTPTFAAGSNPTDQLMGVASFRRDDTPLGAGRRLGMLDFPNPPVPRIPASFSDWFNPGLGIRTAIADVTTYLPSVAQWGPPPEGFATKDGTWINPALPAVVVPPDTTNLPSVASGWPIPQALPPTFSFVRSGNALGTVAAPFNTISWPNPRAAQRSTDLLTWINQGIKGVIQDPFRQTDWPNPKGHALRSGYIFQTPPGIHDTNVYMPSVALDWYTPPAKPQTLSYVLPLNLPLATFAPPAPFRQTDWPNPRAARRSNALLTWINGLPPIQFVVRDALVTRYNYQSWHVALSSQPRANLLPLTAPAVAQPFKQTDWPNPRSAQRQTGGRVYSGLPLLNDPNTYLPSVASDWTVPLPALRQPLSYTLPRNLPLNTVVVVAPFAQYNWPNPRQPAPTGGLSWSQSPHPLQRPNIQPFNKSDWTVPAGRSPLAQSFTLPYSLPLNTLVTKPFSQTNWPNPKQPERNIGQRGWFSRAQIEVDTNTYPSSVTGWPNPTWPVTPNALRTLIGNSQILLFPAGVVPPVEPPPGNWSDPGFWTEQHGKIKELEERRGLKKRQPEEGAPVTPLSEIPEFIAPPKRAYSEDEEIEEILEMLNITDIAEGL